jgi:hypothetical protein
VASVNAYNGYSLNMLNLNLSNEARYGIARWVNSNIVDNYNGTLYPSTYSVELNINGRLYGDTFAGNFSTDAWGAVTSGTVSGYYESIWNGSAWVPANSVTGFSYSAVDFYDAAISGVQSATTWIEVNVLSGNDTITGSTGNDILYGGIGNDIINGGGGIDTAEYMDNFADYTIVRRTDGSTLIVDNGPAGDDVDILYNITYLQFANETIAVNSLPQNVVVGVPNQMIGTGPVKVLLIGNEYVLGSNNGGSWTGPTLQSGHAPVTAAQLGAWAPIGAATLAGGGYEVAFKNATTGQFRVWNTDASGNVISSATGGPVSGQSFALQDLEPGFQQDLNGDGRLSAQLVTTTGANDSVNLTGQTQATTIHLGADPATASTGLKAPSLSFSGTPDDITFGSGPSALEYALTPASGIEMVENFAYSTDLVNIDLLGKPNSSLAAGRTRSLFSAAATPHGVVLLNMHDTAATLLASHTTFAGGHALIS